jgi:DNA helicase-2/ATP-dependent DNA helicase PcrA
MSKNYLENLNPEQQKAVLTTEGPVLIVAGAGAGKTKTITHRIIHLIEQGVRPSQILAITFTNKAAKEMKERVMKIISEDQNLKEKVKTGGSPHISTFHALGVHVLKEFGHHMGISRYFTIIDKSDQKSLIKQATTLANYDPKQYEAGKIANVISKAKGEGHNCEEFKNSTLSFFEELVCKVWEKYEELLKKENALDFDDLLQKTASLLKKNKEVREALQNRFLYIHIDEYQDTNVVQDDIANMLAEKNKNICVVGDTDQNIYSWRGAKIKNMLNFEKKYPDVTMIRLEQNYRSTKNILSLANAVIIKNKYRIEKNLFTENHDGEKISLISNYDEASEAFTAVSTIKELILSGVKPEEIAILYRANFQSRVLEDACVKLSIPYHLIGVKFFERKEIKDVLAYIRAALNRESLTDLKRTINTPARGIGKTTVEKILLGQEHALPAAAQKKIGEYRALLDRIKNQIENLPASHLIKLVLKETGIENELNTSKAEEDAERLENLKELVTLASSYDIHGPKEGIERLLVDCALSTEEETEDGEVAKIRLMTVHAAKGLEFEHVFITGLEEGLFPHVRHNEALNEEDAEEERRLFYVAVTRAKKNLHLSYAQTRSIFGSRQVNIPSEFIFELNDEIIERKEGLFDDEAVKPYFKIDF